MRAKSKGKRKISKIFQELKEGQRVSLVREPSEKQSFPKRFQGKTGNIIGKRGRAYIVKIKDNNKEKIFIVNPVHLKKLK